MRISVSHTLVRGTANAANGAQPFNAKSPGLERHGWTPCPGSSSRKAEYILRRPKPVELPVHVVR
jgi:hypothetical protein